MTSTAIIAPAISWPAYLSGVLHGDGWCSPLTIGLRVKDGGFAEAFAAGLNALFGLSLSPRRDERGYWLVRTSNQTGKFNWLRNFEPCNDDDLSSWLRGLFDSEGNAQLWLNEKMGPRSYHRRIAIYSTSVPTLERAAEFFEWLEIPHSFRSTKNSATHYGTKIVWELRVTRREGFLRFADMVGASDPRKQSRIDNIVRSYR